MIATILSALVLAPSYSFAPGSKLAYDVDVAFDGYIPVLGGQQGNVKVSLGVEVQGVAPEGEAPVSTESTLDGFKLVFNGAELPFTLENVQSYFPKNRIQLTKTGKVLKTDAPDVQLPVRLPGLYAKRFPDITFVPVEFPESGVEIGRPFSFRKSFGDSQVEYTMTPKAEKDGVLELDVAMKQSYEVLEDESVTVVEKEEDAVARVKTDVKGTGRILFDLQKGHVRSVDVTANADSKVTELKSGKTSDRKLKTVLKVALRKGA